MMIHLCLPERLHKMGDERQELQEGWVRLPNWDGSPKCEQGMVEGANGTLK